MWHDCFTTVMRLWQLLWRVRVTGVVRMVHYCGTIASQVWHDIFVVVILNFLKGFWICGFDGLLYLGEILLYVGEVWIHVGEVWLDV